MPTPSNELEQLKVDAILSPNKPLTRLAIYKWLDKHDISIHSDEVVKLDNLIQAILATQNTALLKELLGQKELLQYLGSEPRTGQVEAVLVSVINSKLAAMGEQ